MAKKRYYNIVQLPLLSIILLVLIYSCSTKKNTFTRRAYHNLTSHFNAYWNGKESLKVGVKELASKHKDDYNKVLSVYQYGTKEDATSVFPRMDRAIKKAAIVIQKHSIFIRKKEHIKWIDDAYMLMGKAHFYKQEYRQAIRTFDFIIKRYKDNPIIYEAMLWIARSKNVMGKYDEAQSLLDEIQNKINKKKAPKSYEKE